MFFRIKHSKHLIRKNILVYLLLVLSLSANSQGRTGLFAGIGIMRYNGDVGRLRNMVITPVEVLNLYGKVGISYRMGRHVEATLGFMHGSIEDADSLSENDDQILRNQSFKSPIDEISLQFELSLFDVTRQQRVNPFLMAGAGIFRFKPKAYLDGNWYDLHMLGTEGQYLNEAEYAQPYRLTEYSMILGAGVSFQLAPAWRLKLEAAYHMTTTDFLDDVSTIYPDSLQLASSPNGLLAVQLSNRRLEPFYPEAGRSRGNADSKDSFIHLGLVIVFNPGGVAEGRGNGGYRKRKNLRRLRKGQRCPAFDS